MDGPSRIEMLLRRVKQTLNWQRRGDGNIEPFKIASFRERKVADDLLAFLNRGTLEDNDHPRFVCTSIILTNDTGFPKFPDVTDFLWQKRGDSVHSHTWLETVIRNDFHRVSSSYCYLFYCHTQAEYCSRKNSIHGNHARNLEQTCAKMENSCGIVGNNKLIRFIANFSEARKVTCVICHSTCVLLKVKLSNGV